MDSPLYGKLSEEGGLTLPCVKPAGVLQKLSKALDGREKIPALVSALGNECSSVSLLWLNGRGRREWEHPMMSHGSHLEANLALSPCKCKCPLVLLKQSKFDLLLITRSFSTRS